MMIMKAFILAAGQGARLLPLTKETPKTLLNIKGTTILEYQLVTLASCNVKEVVIIGGFRVDKIRQAVDRYIALHGLDLSVKVIVNKEYDITNNLFSLWLAKDEMTTDFLVINGDNVFDRRALIKTINTPNTNVVLAIHKNPSYDDEDMKVKLDGNQVTAISKKIDNYEAQGESMGLRIFKGAGVVAFKHALDMAMLEDTNRSAFFVKAIQHMIDHGQFVSYCDVTEFEYGELDFHEDLKHLENEMSGLMMQALMLYTSPAGVFARTNGLYAGIKKAV